MKSIIFAVFIGAGIALAAPVLADYKRITSEAEFRKAVVGKTFQFPDYSNRIMASGRFKGKTNRGDKFSGRWVWQKQMWCRSLVVGTQKRPDDCVVMEIDGSNLRARGKNGKAPSSVGSLK